MEDSPDAPADLERLQAAFRFAIEDAKGRESLHLSPHEAFLRRIANVQRLRDNLLAMAGTAAIASSGLI
jgi:hypothetical protein